MFFRRKPKSPETPSEPADTLPENKRKQYRGKQTSQDSIEFKVRKSDDVEFEGEFVDASIGGAAARFTLANEPGLSVGDEVEVCITAKNRDRGIETPAKVVYVEPGGDQHWRYAFEFTSIGNLYAQMDEFHAQIFNRRKDRRIQIPPEQAIRAKILWGENSMDCKLHDLSIGGMSTLLLDEKAQRLEDIERVRVQIDLHLNGQIIEGPAFLRHRKILPGRVLLGVEFKVEGEGGFRANQAELDRFITARRIVIDRWERAIRSA